MIKDGKHVNRTGVATSPLHSQALVELARRSRPTTEGDETLLVQTRTFYADASSDVGSVPPPASGQGAEMIARKGGAVLLDKLGERLAFERAGVRLYDALLDKLEAYGSWDEGPTRAELEEIRAQELEHFQMLSDILTRLGADPTAVTPSADLQAVIAKGLPHAVMDPRTDLLQCLEAVLVAELVDNDCWETLEDLAAAVGDDQIVPQLVHALAQEREHLRKVRLWHAIGLSQRATGGTAEAFVERELRRPREPLRTRASTARAGGKKKKAGARRTGKVTKRSTTRSTRRTGPVAKGKRGRKAR